MTDSVENPDLPGDADELTIWFERLDPLQVRAYGGAPARDDYSNIYFVGTGKSRAHAGRLGRRPDCIPADVQADWSHDPWTSLHPEIPRCAVCLERYPVAQVIDHPERRETAVEG